MDKEVEEALAQTDLPAVAADTQKDEPAKEAPAEPEPTDGEFGQFKDAQALLDGYKNVQAFATRASQENKDLKARLEALEAERLENVPAPQNVPDPQIEYENLVENPGKTIADVVRAQSVADAMTELELESLEDSSVAPYQERFQWASAASNNPKYAHLANSAAGVKKLFKIGDKMRDSQAKANAHKQLETIFGEPVDDAVLTKFRQLLKTDEKQETQPTTNAYMPDSTTSTFRPGPEAEQQTNHDTAISNAADKGDLDGTLQALFQKHLAE